MRQLTSCTNERELRAYLGGQLTPTAILPLTEHLTSCADCRRLLDEIAANTPSNDKTVPVGHTTPQTAPSLDPGATTPPDPSEIGLQAAHHPPDLPLGLLRPTEQPDALGRLGAFDVKRIIGRGGMGVVLEAFDTTLHREVAIKVLSASLASSDVARTRFLREARAAASVRHENVIAIHAVDDSPIAPYLVMEYVPGESLEELIDRTGPLPLPDILRIGAQAAAGLAAAHSQGLIHRDIKPGNILLENGGERVKLTDFGLARCAEDVRLTQTGVVTGTPQYMSPEQAQGQAPDHRSDLFSFGGVLYAMCVGRAPFQASNALAMLRAVASDRQAPIRSLNPAIPEWLTELIDTLLEKHPEDRLQSTSQLAELFRRHWLSVSLQTPMELPISPRRRRNMVLGMSLAGVAGVLVGLAIGGAAEWYGWIDVFDAIGPVRALKREDSRVLQTLRGGSGPVWSTGFFPDGQTLVMALDDGSVKLWDPLSGAIKGTFSAHRGPIWSLAFDPRSKQFATASDDGTVRIWDAKTLKERVVFPIGGAARCVAIDPGATMLAVGCRDGTIIVWDLKTGEELHQLEGHASTVVGVVFSPDGKSIGSASGDKTARIWDVETGREMAALVGHQGGVWTVAFSPDGKKIATGGWDKTVRLWDARTGDQIKAMEGHEADIWQVAFSPDGRKLASASEDRTVRRWNVESHRPEATLAGHNAAVYCITFSPDGMTIASGGRDGNILVWDANARK